MVHSSKWMGITSVALVTMFFATWTTAEEDRRELPRYRLQVGQELVFRGSSAREYNGLRWVDNDAWTFWVVRANPDQSWRLIGRHLNSSLEFNENKVLEDATTTIKAVWFDVFPDGRIVDNPWLPYGLNPAKVLPPLPRTVAEAEGGWETPLDHAAESARYRRLPESTSARFVAERLMDSPGQTLSGGVNRSVITFDSVRGLPQSVVRTGGGGIRTIELASVNARSPEWCQQFADESERLFATLESYERVDCSRAPSELEAELARLEAEINQVTEALQFDEFWPYVAQHANYRKECLPEMIEFAEERTRLLGVPLADWETTDLTGQPHALKDYRSKIVVLDFWYRGCTYCIQGMPHVMEIAAHFEGRPVVVFGMNIDENIEDAQFVVDKLQLKFPQLKAADIAAKYGISSCPVLLILDQQGVVRDVPFISYTLKADVIQSVERLLKREP